MTDIFRGFDEYGSYGENNAPVKVAAGKPKLDEFHAHEALHAAHIALEVFDTHVSEHPYIASNEALRVQAEAITKMMYELYKGIPAEV